MTRPRVAALLAVLLGLPTLALADDNAKELAKFTGTWVVQSVERAGKQSSEEEVKQLALRLHVKGKDYEVTSGELKIDKGTLAVTAGKSPKAIDVKPAAGANAAKGIPAIYEFKDDELRICYDMSGQKRPGEFKTKEGSQQVFITYKKAN